jgi:hypothetical protein
LRAAPSLSNSIATPHQRSPRGKVSEQAAKAVAFKTQSIRRNKPSALTQTNKGKGLSQKVKLCVARQI